MEIDNNEEENQNNELDDNKKENEEKDSLNIYFIENHNSDNEIRIRIVETKFASELETILKDTFIKGETEFSYSIYKFQFFPLKTVENDDVIIIMTDLEKDIEFCSRIKIKDNNKNIFLYDIKFLPFSNNNLLLENPPESFPLSHQEQFEFYINYLRKKKFLQNSEENADLIRSTHKLLNTEGQNYDFSFYLMIFSECFHSSVIKDHLEIFKPEKLRRFGEIKIEQTKQMKLLKAFFKKIEEDKSSKFLENIGKEGEKCRINFYTIDLYYNYISNKEHFLELLNNNEIQNDIYNSLLNYNSLFQGIKFTKEQFQILINKCPNYQKLLNALSYADDILELLQIFKNNFQKIASLYTDNEKKTKSKKKNIINIESIKAAKNTDNLKEISDLYIELINLQIKKTKSIFLLFSDKLCESYIEYFEYKNVNNLFYLKNILKALKKNKIEIKLKNKYLEKIIHETGLELSKKKLLKNIEILDFINNEIAFNKSYYKYDTSLEIFNGLELDKIDENFMKKWKEIIWNEIFEEIYTKFLEKITKLVLNIKNFNILFKLFNVGVEDEKLNPNVLKILQKKLIELVSSYNVNNKFENYNEDLILLIFYSEINKCNIGKFLNKIEKKINFDIVNKVYIELLKRYKDQISPETKSMITNFFIDNPYNSNSDTLLYIIDNCPELIPNILKGIEKFKIEKYEFWRKEESENLKLFKGLLERKNSIKAEEYEMTEYARETKDVIEDVYNDIINGEISYKDINYFYNNNKKDTLYERLLLINLNDLDSANKSQKTLDEYIDNINKILNDLILINADLVQFLYNKESETIKILNDIMANINNGQLNFYKNIYDTYNDLVLKFKEKAVKRALIKKSSLFNSIYSRNLQIFKTNDEKCIEETELKFDQLFSIFSEKGVHSLNQEILQICLNTIKGQKKEVIDKEMDILIKAFQDRLIDINYNKEQIMHSMIILSKKEDIYKAASAISIFIEKIGAIKDNYYMKMINILSNLKNTNDEKIIESAMESLLYGSVDIDILYEKNRKGNYLNILFKFTEQPESIIFLIKRSVEDCRSLQELVGEIENGFLSSNDIIELEKCVEFMNKIGNEQAIKKKKDIEIIKSFINEVEKNQGIEVYFSRYIDNYPELKNLIEYGLDKSEASKQK